MSCQFFLWFIYFFFLVLFPFFNESIFKFIIYFVPYDFWYHLLMLILILVLAITFSRSRKQKEKKNPKTTTRDTCINGLFSAIKCKQQDIKQLSRGLLALNVDCWENMFFDINNLVLLWLFFCFFFFFFRLQDILIISKQQNNKDVHVYMQNWALKIWNKKKCQ